MSAPPCDYPPPCGECSRRETRWLNIFVNGFFFGGLSGLLLGIAIGLHFEPKPGPAPEEVEAAFQVIRKAMESEASE